MREEKSPHRIRARARSRLLAHHLGSPANRQGGMTGEYFRIISRPILTYSQKNGGLNDINAQYSRSCQLLSFSAPSGATKARYVYTASARAAARPLASTECRAISYRHRAYSLTFILKQGKIVDVLCNGIQLCCRYVDIH